MRFVDDVVFFVEYIVPFVEDIVFFVEDIVPFVEDIVSFVEDIVPFVEDIVFFVEYIVPFVEDIVFFVEDIVSFVEDIVSFVEDIVFFVEHIVSFVEDIVPFVEDTVPFVEDIVFFVEDIVSFVEDIVSFVEDVVPFVEDVVGFVEDVGFGPNPCVLLVADVGRQPIATLRSLAYVLLLPMPRSATEKRTTKETEIEVSIDLDGRGQYDIVTPLPFLTHMLEQIARHGLFDLTVRAKGDTHIDGHHTTEDVAIVLGKAVAKALASDPGTIARYGAATLPMDEARASVAIDLSNRTFFVFEGTLPKAKLGEFDSELAEVFFEGFARGAACNLHVVLHAGHILHHMIEVSFKAFAKALSLASRIEPRASGVPSTKGTL